MNCCVFQVRMSIPNSLVIQINRSGYALIKAFSIGFKVGEWGEDVIWLFLDRLEEFIKFLALLSYSSKYQLNTQFNVQAWSSVINQFDRLN